MVPFENTRETYGLVSRSLHWITLLIILTQYAYGISVVVEHDRSFAIFDSAVESLGMLLIPITLFRIYWSILNGLPDLPSSIKPAQVATARAIQFTMYFMILLCATTGFAIRNQDRFFYRIEIPDLFDLGNIALVHHIHDIGVYVLAFLILVHIAAAIFHGILKDGVVKTMISLH